MTRTWSVHKDGMGFYYTTDGTMPMLNVRLEILEGGKDSDLYWVAYCGDDRVPVLNYSRANAQAEAEKYWEANYGQKDRA
jgi:hypothetical protein